MPILVGNSTVNTNITSSNLTGTGALWLVPTGVIFPYVGAAAPTGWLLCNGTAVSRTTYAALFAVIGTAYGAGDGSTTFNLPNISDKVVVGVGGAKTRGATGGVASVTPSGSVSVANHTLTTAQIPAHNHPTSDPGHSHAVYDPTHRHLYGFIQQMNAFGSGERVQDYSSPLAGVYSTSHACTGIGIYSTVTNISILNSGGGQGHNHGASFTGNSISVEQPYIVTNHIIKF